MFRDPILLIDQSIDSLQTLAELFADEAGERLAFEATLTPKARVCKEAVQTIRVLLPKLQAARETQVATTRGQRACIHCEE